MSKTYDFNDTTQLSPHFNISEFRCKCGKEHETLNNPELIEKLEKLYDALLVQNQSFANALVLPKKRSVHEHSNPIYAGRGFLSQTSPEFFDAPYQCIMKPVMFWPSRYS